MEKCPSYEVTFYKIRTYGWPNAVRVMLYPIKYSLSEKRMPLMAQMASWILPSKC